MDNYLQNTIRTQGSIGQMMLPITCSLDYTHNSTLQGKNMIESTDIWREVSNAKYF